MKLEDKEESFDMLIFKTMINNENYENYEGISLDVMQELNEKIMAV